MADENTFAELDRQAGLLRRAPSSPEHLDPDDEPTPFPRRAAPQDSRGGLGKWLSLVVTFLALVGTGLFSYFGLSSVKEARAINTESEEIRTLLDELE